MDGIHEGKSGTGRERGEKIHFPKRLAFVFDLTCHWTSMDLAQRQAIYYYLGAHQSRRRGELEGSISYRISDRIYRPTL